MWLRGKGKRLLGAVASREGAAAPTVHLLTEREGSVHAVCGALSPCTVTTVAARVTCAQCHETGTTVPEARSVPIPEPACPYAPTTAARLDARCDRAEDVLREMMRLGDEVRALMLGMGEDTRELAVAAAKGEVHASALEPFIRRWARIQALAAEAQARWAAK